MTHTLNRFYCTCAHCGYKRYKDLIENIWIAIQEARDKGKTTLLFTCLLWKINLMKIKQFIKKNRLWQTE